MRPSDIHSPWMKQLRFIVPVGIMALLFFTFRQYRTAYFWLDDFNALHWASVTTSTEMLWALLNPASHYFRPTGMVFYWLGLRLFGMNEVGFHLTAWSLHALNTGLVYVVLKRITRSRPGAAVGAMLFASQIVFSDLYWMFGAIFDLVSGLFFFLGIYLWTSETRTWKKVVFSTIAFVFAIKGKEMAITLPAIWIGYDVIVRTSARWRYALQILLPGCISVFYALMSLHALRESSPDAPYYMDVRGLVLAQGYRFYLNALFQTDFQWQIWAAGFVVLAVLLAMLKAREALFFEFYVFITLLPVIFLVNHRFAFYWYIPLLGICGLAAVLVRWLSGLASARIPSPFREVAACVVFIVLCRSVFFATKAGSAGSRWGQRALEVEYRGLTSGLRSLPTPPLNETLYCSRSAAPSHFDDTLLEESIQLTLGRPDLHARLVDEFPAETKYRLKFQNSKLVLMTDGH